MDTKALKQKLFNKRTSIILAALLIVVAILGYLIWTQNSSLVSNEKSSQDQIDDAYLLYEPSEEILDEIGKLSEEDKNLKLLELAQKTPDMVASVETELAQKDPDTKASSELKLWLALVHTLAKESDTLTILSCSSIEPKVIKAKSGVDILVENKDSSEHELVFYDNIYTIPENTSETIELYSGSLWSIHTYGCDKQKNIAGIAVIYN